ncbi:MAG: hypothetical protein M1825_003534 [Sarcosagium campestre]|nr:MAG: hypothetical protein M1825_003534 [Sarcosagium campestre]
MARDKQRHCNGEELVGRGRDSSEQTGTFTIGIRWTLIKQNALSIPKRQHIEIIQTIAVIRISGLACLEIYSALCPGRANPKPRQATVRTLYRPDQPASVETILDSEALLLYFPGPGSVTGEDVLELHVHGGAATVKVVLSAISQYASSSSSRLPIRYAEPGEFTRRAFLNDRLDLMQIEALGDTLAAETEQQRRLSVRSGTGGGATSALSRRYESWRQLLLHARAELEAIIDFAEDQHLDESPRTLFASISARVQTLIQHMRVHISNAVRGELLRSGIRLSLLGAANAGKSSLLNLLVGREAAIVSRHAGTTRDVVEVGLDIEGWYCLLGDTAGLRRNLDMGSKAADAVVDDVEHEGIARAKSRALSCDAVIVVLSVEQHGATSELQATLSLDADVVATVATINSKSKNVIVVVNKLDLLDAADRLHDSSAQTELPSLPTEWLDAITAAIPNLPRSRIFGISCRAADIAASVPSSSSSSSSALSMHANPAHSSRAQQYQKHQQEQNKASPSGIPLFLKGLVTLFKDITAPLTTAASATSTSTSIPPPGTETDAAETDAIETFSESDWQDSLGTTHRQRVLLEQCLHELDSFLASVSMSGFESDQVAAEPEPDVVVAAEQLRRAAECLARITGRGVEAGDVDEVLGVVFEK